MNIFVKIKNSIYNPKYYNEVLKNQFSYSFKYYVVFALIFAVAFSIFVTIKFIPTAGYMSEQFPKLSEHFPKDLTVNIKDGRVSTNVPEPYFVKLPQGLKDNSGNDKPDTANLDNLIVINTKDKFDIDAFNSYKTLALLTADSIIYLNENNQVTINSLAGVKEFTMNRAVVAGFIDKLKPFLVFIYPFVFMGAYIGGFVFIMAEMIYLLFGALLIWLMAEIKGMKIGYKKSYQAGLHLIVAPIITTSILNAFSVNIPIPYLFTILLVLSATLNLRKDAPQSVASV